MNDFMFEILLRPLVVPVLHLALAVHLPSHIHRWRRTSIPAISLYAMGCSLTLPHGNCKSTTDHFLVVVRFTPPSEGSFERDGIPFGCAAIDMIRPHFLFEP